MTHCTLQNEKARETVAYAWKHLRKHFPADARFLSAIIRSIAPLSDAEAADGTSGQWFPESFNSPEEQRAYYLRYGDAGDGYGTLKLLDSTDITVGIVAHEMGHAFTSEDHLYERAAPDDAWAMEAAADMHAVRWGLLTIPDIRDRYERNTSAPSEIDPLGTCWLHHGPPPGGDGFELWGRRWHLNEDFIFEGTPITRDRP